MEGEMLTGEDLRYFRKRLESERDATKSRMAERSRDSQETGGKSRASVTQETMRRVSSISRSRRMKTKSISSRWRRSKEPLVGLRMALTGERIVRQADSEGATRSSALCDDARRGSVARGRRTTIAYDCAGETVAAEA